ncbi:MAG: RNA polymerase sigma factor [Thermoanaerobaculia bacterium]
MEVLFSGDEAFSEIFGRYREPIHRYVLTLVREAGAADDLTQETFVRAYRKLPTLEDPSKVSSWLYRIATNLSYDRFRKASRRDDMISLDGTSAELGDPLPTEPADDSPRLDKVVEQREMSGCVQDYLEELPDDYRAVILLHDLEGLTNPEIAAMLGCSLATAKIRLHRARKKLKQALDNACKFTHDERDVFVCERKPSSGGVESG